MKYSSRFFLYAPITVFAVLCIAAGVNWWGKASALSGRLAAANGHEVMPGVTVSFASKKISGFPFSLDTELSGFALTVATPNGPTRWASEKFAMHALTYGRDETIFEAAGRQRLEWGGGHALDFAVGALHASAIVRHEGLDRFDLDLVGFGSKAFTAQRLQVHVRQDAKAAQLFVAADGVTDCRRTAVRYAATVTRAEAFGRLQLGEESWTGAVADWQRGGGKVLPDKPDPLALVPAAQSLDPAALANAVCGRP